MKMRRYVGTVLCIAVAFLLGCAAVVDDFTVIKQYKPDDKYFTASLKSLHFIIETSDIARVDSTFGKIFEGYGLPTSAKGCKDGVFAMPLCRGM